MHILERTNRFRRIERRFNSSVGDLMYQMHWLEDMKHRDIALNFHIPRATITRWFGLLHLPTQSCRRFTDKNLTSWLYKTGKLKKKDNDGQNKQPQQIRKQVNERFFKKWSPEMAYVLGYFAADGCMFINPRGSKYVSFTSTDLEILEKIKRMLNSEHKLTLKKGRKVSWKDSFTLQIGSKRMYADLIKRGFMPNKALRFRLPSLPKKYARHFIRGYFDGDGSITYGYAKRKNRHNKLTPYVLTCFASANLRFLEGISNLLRKNSGVMGGYIDKKGGHLAYSKLDSIKLFRYIYSNVDEEQYLERKHSRFLKAVNFGVVG